MDLRQFFCTLIGFGAYTGEERRRRAHVSWKGRRLLAAGYVRSGSGGRNPHYGNFPGGSSVVPGGIRTHRVRLRLLQALERSKYHANCSVEVPQSPQRHSAEAVQDFGISSPGRAYSVSRARLRGQHGGAQGRESGRWRPLPPRTVFQAAGNGCAVHRRTNGRKGRANHGTGIEKGLLRRL
mgnify:CR=1 FL=1